MDYLNKTENKGIFKAKYMYGMPNSCRLTVFYFPTLFETLTTDVAPDNYSSDDNVVAIWNIKPKKKLCLHPDRPYC